MVLRLAAEVLEDAPLPHLLHVVPVLNDTVVNRVVHVVRRRVGLGLWEVGEGGGVRGCVSACGRRGARGGGVRANMG